MTSVFLVWHTYSEDGGDDELSNAKLLGVYSDRGKAAGRVARSVEQRGFQDWPEGFTIDEYVVDADHWRDGFIRG